MGAVLSFDAVEALGQKVAKAIAQRTELSRKLRNRPIASSAPGSPVGNFPRIEIVFDCVEASATTSGEDQKYTKLANLKKLLDSGALTQAEFESEKAKVLNQP